MPDASTEAALETLKDDSKVAAAEPDYRWKVSPPIQSNTSISQLRSNATPSSSTPNDPLYPTQWALKKIGAPEAWKTTTGSRDIIIADMDSGINLTHKDLAANIYTNQAELHGKPGVDDDGNGYVDDVHGWNGYDGNGNVDDVWAGHGTHTAGIMGAVGNNGQLITGINWKLTIVPVRILDQNNGVTVDAVIQCADYILALRKKGVNVRAVNCSFGNTQSPFTLAWLDSFKALDQAGILTVCAANNDSLNADLHPQNPAGFDLTNSIAVGASDYDDNRAPYSNYGVQSVDIFAPGSTILSTYWHSPTALAELGGTSQAAPMVTGAAALLWASQPSLTALQVKQRILASATRVVQLRPFVKNGLRLNVGALLNNAVFTIYGTTTTFDGKSRLPVGGVSIFLDGHTGTPDAITDSKGLYSLVGISGGLHTVRAELNDAAFGQTFTVNLPTGKETAPSSTIVNFVATLQQSKRYSIYGHVDQDLPHGKTRPKANVDIYLNDSTVPFTRSNAKGDWKISNLAAGNYAVRLVDSQTGEKASTVYTIQLPDPRPKDDDEHRYSPDGYHFIDFAFSDHTGPVFGPSNFDRNPTFTPATMPKFFQGSALDESGIDAAYTLLLRFPPDGASIQGYDADRQQWVDFFTDFGLAGYLPADGSQKVPFKFALPTLELGYNYELYGFAVDTIGNQSQKEYPFTFQDSPSAKSSTSKGGSSPSAGGS